LKLCSVCLSEHRHEVDAGILIGVSNRELAELARTSLAHIKHHRRHLPGLFESERGASQNGDSLSITYNFFFISSGAEEEGEGVLN
jgi:hypothetical protein